MVRRSISALLLASAVSGAAFAQWTQIADEPCVWSYGDSIGSYTVPTGASASVFANGKFWVVGGYGQFDLSWGIGSDRVQLKEGKKPWDWNRQSKVSAFNGTSWETAGTQDLLVHTGLVFKVDDLNIYTFGDVTDKLQPLDFIKVVSGRGMEADMVNSFGLVIKNIYYDALEDATYIEFYNTCCGWMHVPDWYPDMDKIYLTTVVGHTGMNNWDAEPGIFPGNANAGPYPPLCSNGNFSYSQTNVGAWDKDGDGKKEIFVFGGYPNWPPFEVDYYNEVTGYWYTASSSGVGGSNPGVRGAGGQVGAKFVWNIVDNRFEVYDFASDSWTFDDVGVLVLNRRANIVGFPFGGPNGTAYILTGVGAGKKLLRYPVLTGEYFEMAPPPITGMRAQCITYANRYILAFGGTTLGESDFSDASLTDAIQIYDTQTDTWTVSAVPMPYKGANVAVGLDPNTGIVYLTGGFVGYNPNADPPNNASHPLCTKMAYKIHISQLIPTQITVTGRLNLEFHTNPAAVNATLQVYAVGGNTVLETKALTLDGSGNFTTTLSVAPGNYDLRFGAPNFLWKRLGNVALASGTNNVGVVPLLNGDGTGNNLVDLPDLSLALTNFGKPGPGDYDGNGIVGLTDLSIPLVNFGKAGNN